MASSQTVQVSCVKTLAESKTTSIIPSSYYTRLSDPHDRQVADELGADIPIIDFSQLNSKDPLVHSNAVLALGKACEEWGFFMVINHGIPQSLIDETMDLTYKFFNMPSEKKAKFGDQGVLNQIRYGTSFNVAAEEIHFWRDYLKIFTHPHFVFPDKPENFKEVGEKYCKHIRAVARKLLQCISESLGMDPDAIIRAADFDNGLQVFIANFYPPCPQPELALGLPPHSDHGMLTLLTQNGIGGLQIKRDGKWVNVNPLPNSFIINVADQLEIISNGKCKSILHRATLNNKDTRISIACTNGPNFDKVVNPPPELLDKEDPVYKSMTYKEYYEFQQNNKLDGKTCMEYIRIKS